MGEDGEEGGEERLLGLEHFDEHDGLLALGFVGLGVGGVEG